MKKLLFASMSLVILGISCKKSTPTPDPVAATKFMTYTAGTFWNYQTTDNTTQVVTPYVLTATSTDTTINTKVYHIFSSVDANGTTSEYYNNTGNDYFQYTQLSAQLPPMELKYLNDVSPVGTTWSQPISITQSGVTLTADIKNTIMEKGFTETVNSIAYTNVTRVKTEIVNLSSSNPLVSVSILTQNIATCFAPKFGLIKREFALHITASALGSSQDVINTSTTNQLMSSNIQ